MSALITAWLEWPTTCLMVSGAILLAFLYKFLKQTPSTTKQRTPTPTEPTSYPPVEPLPNFTWQTKEPIKLRPFKPKYHLTMSVSESTINDLIEIDKNYLDRITLRKSIMSSNPETVLAAEPTSKPPIDEFYTWLVGTLLPTRFPRMFVIEHAAALRSLVTNETFPLQPAKEPLTTLHRMGSLIDDDLLFLLPSEDGDGYTLKGFVTCFPSGFNTSKKLNLKLRDIHTPVPNYKEKLEKSMDRYFARLPTGKFIQRANWSITVTDQLFTPEGNHLYEGEEIPQQDIDINVARVRCERQFLHRLPQTRALLFSFKTYLYPLPEIRAEGLGEALAEAIDGLKGGSVPGFHVYKRAAVWGEAAKGYLRS